MKMAKASQADLDAAMELYQFLEAMRDGRSAAGAVEDFGYSGYDDLVDQKATDAEFLLRAHDRGGLMRVAFGMGVLLDPRNEIVDPNLDHLEHHPKHRDAEQRVAAAIARAEKAEAELLNMGVRAGCLEAERDAARAEVERLKEQLSLLGDIRAIAKSETERGDRWMLDSIEVRKEVERLRAELAALGDTVGDWKRSAQHAIDEKEEWKTTAERVCKILGADVNSVEANATLAMEALRTPNAAVDRLRGLLGATAKATGAEIDSLKSALADLCAELADAKETISHTGAVVCKVHRERDDAMRQEAEAWKEVADLRAYRDRTEAALAELHQRIVDHGSCVACMKWRDLGLARDAKGAPRG